MKKILSFLLILTMLIGAIPAYPVYAEDTIILGVEEPTESVESDSEDILEDNEGIEDIGLEGDLEAIADDIPSNDNPAKGLDKPKIVITGYNFSDEELFTEVYEDAVVGAQRFQAPIKLQGYEFTFFGGVDTHVYNGDSPDYNGIHPSNNAVQGEDNVYIDIYVEIYTVETILHFKLFYREVEDNNENNIVEEDNEEKEEKEKEDNNDEIVKEEEKIEEVENNEIEDFEEDDFVKEEDTTSDDTSSNISDRESQKEIEKIMNRENENKRNEHREKIKLLVPYTILEGTKLDLIRATGISIREMKTSNLNTSKMGVQVLEIDILNETFKYPTEVIELKENHNAKSRIPLDHWSSQYARDVISKGYIKGDIDGDLMLDNTLQVADAFTAYDRLLLNHNIIEMKTDRDTIDKVTKGLGETWYTYPVKSILSKYDKKDLSSVDLSSFTRPIRREEIAQILYNSLQDRLEQNKHMVYYTDLYESSNIEALIFCTKTGLLEGYNDGTIKPKGNLTKAEFMAVLSRIDLLLIKG